VNSRKKLFIIIIGLGVLCAAAYLIAGVITSSESVEKESTAQTAKETASVQITEQAPVDASAKEQKPSGEATPRDRNPQSEKERRSETAVKGPISPQVLHPAPRPSEGPGKRSRITAFRLVRTMLSIGIMEEAGKTPLTPAQAKSVLAVVEPLRDQETLDPQQAESAVQKINEILTDEQKAAIMQPASIRRDFSGNQGNQPRQREQLEQKRTDRTDGERPQRPNIDANPLNPDSKHPVAGRLQSVYDALKAKAR